MNYKKQLFSFSIEKITYLSLFLFIIPFMIAFLLNIFLFNADILLTDKVYFDVLITIAIVVVCLPLHELLHALTAVIVGKTSFKDISFGVNLKQGMLYCHFNKPTKVKYYRVVLLVPVIVTGIIPLIISMVIGNVFLIVAFSLLVSGGAGDFFMYKATFLHNSNDMILDHPKAPAYYILYPEDNLPSDFVEATEEQEKELEEKMKEVPFSKGDGKKHNAQIKVLLILLFLAGMVLGIFLLGLAMQFI